MCDKKPARKRVKGAIVKAFQPYIVTPKEDPVYSLLSLIPDGRGSYREIVTLNEARKHLGGERWIRAERLECMIKASLLRIQGQSKHVSHRKQLLGSSKPRCCNRSSRTTGRSRLGSRKPAIQTIRTRKRRSNDILKRHLTIDTRCICIAEWNERAPIMPLYLCSPSLHLSLYHDLEDYSTFNHTCRMPGRVVRFVSDFLDHRGMKEFAIRGDAMCAVRLISRELILPQELSGSLSGGVVCFSCPLCGFRRLLISSNKAIRKSSKTVCGGTGLHYDCADIHFSHTVASRLDDAYAAFNATDKMLLEKSHRSAFSENVEMELARQLEDRRVGDGAKLVKGLGEARINVAASRMEAGRARDVPFLRVMRDMFGSMSRGRGAVSSGGVGDATPVQAAQSGYDAGTKAAAGLLDGIEKNISRRRSADDKHRLALLQLEEKAKESGVRLARCIKELSPNIWYAQLGLVGGSWLRVYFTGRDRGRMAVVDRKTTARREEKALNVDLAKYLGGHQFFSGAAGSEASGFGEGASDDQKPPPASSEGE